MGSFAVGPENESYSQANNEQHGLKYNWSADFMHICECYDDTKSLAIGYYYAHPLARVLETRAWGWLESAC